MDNEELRDRSRQLAREELDAVRWEALNVPLPDETRNNYEPLPCHVCGADLLETRWPTLCGPKTPIVRQFPVSSMLTGYARVGATSCYRPFFAS